MASLSIAIFLQLLLFVGAFYAVEVNSYSTGDGDAVALAPTGDEEQPEFDYFALTVQWPPTLCSKSTKCCTQSGCCRGSNSPSVFTIHGLWPDYDDGTWPSCCSGPAFNETEILPLMGVLEQYWPTLSCSNTSTCHKKKGLFWAHEWEKHGTCSSPVTGDEYNYFLTTINLYFTYNVTEVLFEAGYVPSNTVTYPASGIISAIENAYHTTPQIICTKGSLEEVRLCLTKDFEFRDCVGKSDCTDDVSIPEYAFPDYVNGTTTAGRLFTGYESS